MSSLRNGFQNVKLRWIAGVATARRERAMAERCRYMINSMIAVRELRKAISIAGRMRVKPVRDW